MGSKRKNIKITAVFLSISILLLTGCGGSRGGAEIPGSSEASGGMGRYVEEFCPLPEDINRNGGLNMLSDGSMTIISYNGGLFRSQDNGASWQKEETPWFPMMQGVYAMAAVMAPDGSVAVTCSGEMPEEARKACPVTLPEDWEGNYCIFVSPEGEIKVVDFGFTQEDGSCISRLCFKEDNRLFAGDMNGKIYEIDVEHESLRELFMMEREAGFTGFCGNVLMAVGQDKLYLYDLEKGEPLQQDSVADQFIKNVLAEGSVSYTGGGYPLTVFGGTDGVIYIACVNGLYRHALGGSTVEQVIDGALSTFGDGDAIFFGREQEGGEFLVQFSGTLVRYHFDETIPAMPDKEIKIYSLEENNSVRSAVTSFKKEHTDMYVRYEVGLSGEDGMTREDAVKKLNTRILSGEGPDVIILDGLPVDSYIEKGMLADISDILGNISPGEELFPNLVKSFRQEDGAVYGMPLCVRVPLLVGDLDRIDRIEDLEDFAEEMERLREEYPEGGLLGIYDAETLLNLFGMVSCPAWIDETGEIDEEALKEFLTQTKRIYEAELSGALPEEVEALRAEDAELENYGVNPVKNKMEVCNNVLDVRRGYAKLACGYVDGIQICLDNVTSVIGLEENMGYKVFPGQEQNVFVPEVMVGISANSGQKETAEAFVRKMFSAEAQKSMYDGFPVNEAAFAGRFAVMQAGSSNGSMTFTRNDGTEEELELLWPDKEQQRVFAELVQGLETPAENREWLSELVYEAGVRVLEEDESVENAVDEIEKRAAIYLAE